jgi:hypothetical protein
VSSVGFTHSISGRRDLSNFLEGFFFFFFLGFGFLGVCNVMIAI